MNYIDKVYYINLDHRSDRLKQIESVLDDLEIPQEKRQRIPAVYNPEFGTVGCCTSHILAVEKFIESGLETCIIFEDDFIYEDKTRVFESLSYIFENKVKFDLIQLSYNHCGLVSENTEHPILHKVLQAGTISGILLHKNFAPLLLQNYKKGFALMQDYIQENGNIHTDYCIDVYWKRIQPLSRWFCFIPRLGYQRQSYSDIEKREVNYGV